jgi:hypothetical protein
LPAGRLPPLATKYFPDGLLVILACLVAACGVGKGKGRFHGCLYYPQCDNEYGEIVDTCVAPSEGVEGNENYTFSPSFFGAQSLENGSLLITIQEDGYFMGESDGLVIVVPDYVQVSKDLGEEEAGYVDKTVPPDPDLESLPQSERYQASYFLYDTCGGETASFSGGTGTIRFYSLYRPDSENETIKAEFTLYFEDPRPPPEGETTPHLFLFGEFEFEYQRGVPAQHFP